VPAPRGRLSKLAWLMMPCVYALLKIVTDGLLVLANNMPSLKKLPLNTYTFGVGLMREI
jgi:hypothetical protein